MLVGFVRRRPARARSGPATRYINAPV